MIKPTTLSRASASDIIPFRWLLYFTAWSDKIINKEKKERHTAPQKGPPRDEKRRTRGRARGRLIGAGGSSKQKGRHSSGHELYYTQLLPAALPWVETFRFFGGAPRSPLSIGKITQWLRLHSHSTIAHHSSN